MVSVSDCLSFRAYVLISREEAISNSFASLGLMAAQIQSQIAGRPLPEAK
ncbi:Putative iron compound-binding protein of ABC transporter family [Escherichia coli ISC41]|nr:Putative iron compound-binding protein of ABC transporter family [Escherichia coli ISC41]